MKNYLKFLRNPKTRQVIIRRIIVSLIVAGIVGILKLLAGFV